MKIVKSLKGFGSLIKGVTKITENETKKRGGFLGMLSGILGGILSGNMLASKGFTQARKETSRTGQEF